MRPSPARGGAQGARRSADDIPAYAAGSPARPAGGFGRGGYSPARASEGDMLPSNLDSFTKDLKASKLYNETVGNVLADQLLSPPGKASFADRVRRPKKTFLLHSQTSCASGVHLCAQCDHLDADFRLQKMALNRSQR